MHRMAKTVLLYLAVQLILSTPAFAAHAYALTCCTVPSSVSVIDRSSHKTLNTLITGQGSVFTALSHDNSTMYVANVDEQSISVLETATGVQTYKISLSSYGVSPYGELLSSDGTTLYIVAVENTSIHVLGVNTSDNSVQFDVPMPGSNRGHLSGRYLPSPAISRDGQHIYLYGTGLIVFDVKTLTSRTLSITQVNSRPQGVAVTPDETYALLTFNGTNNEGGQFVVVNLASKSVQTRIDFPKAETVGSVAVSLRGSVAYFPLNRRVSPV